MKEKIGTVFSIADDNIPIPGCSVSKQINGFLTYYSLSENTDISAEIYLYHKLLIVMDGSCKIYGNNGTKKLDTNDCIVTLTDTPVGIKTDTGTVYAEITIRRTDNMNSVINAGEVFQLKELLPYQEDKIVNIDVVHNDRMKFALMAFDEGTGLSEHAAPGEAIVFALDGEAVIGYEGKEHPIKAGEQFVFTKGGIHSFKATKKFKMALLLTLE